MNTNKNRYKLKTSGLSIEQSILADWCSGKTDNEIIQEILTIHRFYATLDSFNKGEREIELVKIRVHEEGE